MAFAKRSRLRKPRLRTFTVLIRLLMPSAGPLVARRMIALTIPQRCSRIIREVFTTGSRPQPEAQASHRCHPASAQVLLR